MKRLTAIFAIIAISTTMASAQSGPNHFHISASDNLVMNLGTALGGAIATAFTAPAHAALGEVRNYGCYSFGYDRGFKDNRFKAGAELSYSRCYINFVNTDTREIVSENNVDLYMLMVNGSCTYVHKKWFTFYGDLAIGIGCTDMKNINFAFQVDPLAFRFGGDTAGFFIKAGLGLKGIVTAGLDISF